MSLEKKSATVLRHLPTLLSAALSQIKVNFVIAGAQKCGTSALAGYLKAHPQICIGVDRKEIHFFDNEDVFRINFMKYPFYHSFFQVEPHHQIVGESTPEYMWWFDAPRRMWEYNPDMKIIIMLRNPIDRAFSHWKMMRERGQDTVSFWEAIANEEVRCREALPYQHRFYSYINRGFFSEQLRRIWHYFPRHQTLVLRMEELRDDPELTLRRTTDFLGIAPFSNFEERKIVKTRKKTEQMSPEARDYLIETFRCEVACLEKMLDWDCKNWLK